MEGRYYIQDKRSFVGNCVMWWRKNNRGYTTNLLDAEIYTEEEAREICSRRDTDIPWPVKDVQPLILPTVDMQKLRRVPQCELDFECHPPKPEIKDCDFINTNPICPHCEWRMENPEDMDLSDEESIVVECESCRQDFLIKAHIDTTYSTSEDLDA